jgi:CheY-like chemotaxis protein
LKPFLTGVEKKVVFSQEIINNNRMKKKILIVEDEESLRLLYEEELKSEGYEVLTAGNGREAIQQLETGKPDLIILDIVMPVMDGMEALGRIVSKERKIPIILNTSYSGYRQDFMSWAADAYVTKSADLTELKKKIQELLEKGKAR